jgi:hypothetical protein
MDPLAHEFRGNRAWLGYGGKIAARPAFHGASMRIVDIREITKPIASPTSTSRK